MYPTPWRTRNNRQAIQPLIREANYSQAPRFKHEFLQILIEPPYKNKGEYILDLVIFYLHFVSRFFCAIPLSNFNLIHTENIHENSASLY